MTIRPIGQSGYVIKTDKTTLILDPYLSDIVNEVAGRPRMLAAPIRPEDIRADAVICTHDHMDHLDIGAVPHMPQDTFFITTQEGVGKLASLGQTHATALAVGESIVVGDVTLTAVFAHHTCEAFGIVLRGEGKTLYFSGDTLFDKQLFSVADYHPDYTFICINGKLGNMTVEEALVVAKAIGAKHNVPNHYDMFASNTEDPDKFTCHIDGGLTMAFNQEYTL